MKRFCTLALHVALGLLLASCQGDFGEQRFSPGGQCRNAGASLGLIPIRRLSRVEYQNTVRDLLFGVEPVDPPAIPADVTEHGFENVAEQLSAPALLVERYELTATAFAEAAMMDAAVRDQILTCGSWSTAAEQDTCTEELLDTFGRRAFRRPMTDDERGDFRQLISEVTGRIDYEAAIELAVSAMMQSAQFSYRVEVGDGDGVVGPYEMASRLSYFLWQSMPDDSLLDAAQTGELETPEQIETQARRMLEQPRARAAMIDFHRQYLDFDRVMGEPKNDALFPGWSEELRSAIREEADRFVGDVVWGGEGTLSALLTSRTTWVNGPLAEHYGLDPVSDWTEVELPAGERAGILTRADFLAGRAHETNGSPVLRGAFIIDRMLCRDLGAPPDDADTSPVIPDPGAGPQTNRMLFEARTGSSSCQGCHVQIDGIGYGFENYDSTGAYRSIDNTLPVDATGELVGTDVDGPYEGAVEVSEMLAASSTVQDCVARSWVRYALGRTPGSADLCLVDRARRSLRTSGGDLRELMVSIVTSPDFRRGLSQ